MRARLFPFSLLGKALQWFYCQPVETVQDWNALMRAFIKEYYSPGKTQSLHNKIATFAQYPTKTISEAFEHFNEYTRAVPHHKFPKEDLVQKFYQGLTMASRTVIDASAGGSIIELTPTEAFTLFKKVTDNDTWASSGRLLPVQPAGNLKGVLEVEKEDILDGKIDSLMRRLEKKKMERGRATLEAGGGRPAGVEETIVGSRSLKRRERIPDMGVEEAAAAKCSRRCSGCWSLYRTSSFFILKMRRPLELV
jgi:hypothetical protein